MLLAAQAQARSKFEQSRGVSTESEEARKGIEHAESVAVMLRQNIVQGVQETGDAQKYSMNTLGFAADVEAKRRNRVEDT